MGSLVTLETNLAPHRWCRVTLGMLAIALAALPVGGCSFAPAASLGGNTAGERGVVRVIFINNTGHTAVFTAGTYDSLDEVSAPSIAQFGFSGSALTLPPDTESAIGSLPCARVLSVGGSRLLALVAANGAPTSLVQESTGLGVNFYSEGTDDATTAPVAVGASSALELQLAADFGCGALLVIRFEINDVGDTPFRVDFDVIPANSSR